MIYRQINDEEITEKEMVKYKELNVETKVGMQKMVGWGMETVGWKVGGWPSTMACYH